MKEFREIFENAPAACLYICGLLECAHRGTWLPKFQLDLLLQSSEYK
jgi:hypothetical protein